MSLQDKTVLVTGASRGIGRAIAIAAAAGAKVALTARSADTLAETAAAVVAAGGSAHTIVGDAANPASIEEAVASTVQNFGSLDVLINNAGIVDPIARVEAADADDWARCMAVNLTGPALFARYALPHLRAAKGALINISSGAAHRPLEGWAAYCASKAGLWMLTQSLHLEEGEAVDVYAASPGTVDTEMQVLIRASGVNPISQVPRANLAPASLPAAGVVWLAQERPQDLRGGDVNVRDPAFLKRAGIAAA
jgi:3-oxoacyl-[acyl-carrier protein] reductase